MVGLILIHAAPWAVFVVAVISTFAMAAGTRRLHDQARDARAVTQAVDAYAPRVAIPYAGKVGVHVGMWSPWIDRTGCPMVRRRSYPSGLPPAGGDVRDPDRPGGHPRHRQGCVLPTRGVGQRCVHRGVRRDPRVPRPRRQRQAAQRIRTSPPVRPGHRRRSGGDRPIRRFGCAGAAGEAAHHRPPADRRHRPGHRARRRARRPSCTRRRGGMPTTHSTSLLSRSPTRSCRNCSTAGARSTSGDTSPAQITSRLRR